MEFPRISIIIPVYNSEKYLEKCLTTVINQTYSNIEIIIIDDGSSDNSKLICEKYSTIDERIIFISKNNEGVSIARNTGIKIARGEWIYFLDSDDFLELNMFDELLEVVNKTNCDIVQFGYYNYKNGKILSERVPSKYIEYNSEYLKVFLKNNQIGALAAWSHFFKRSIIEENSIFFEKELKHGEDQLFVYSAFCHMKKIIVLNKSFYNYVQSDGSVSRKPLEVKALTDSLLLLSKLSKYVREQNLINDYKDEINSLSKIFFVTALYCKDYRYHKKSLQIKFNNLMDNNEDILDASFLKIAKVNIAIIILILKLSHKIRNISFE